MTKISEARIAAEKALFAGNDQAAKVWEAAPVELRPEISKIGKEIEKAILAVRAIPDTNEDTPPVDPPIGGKPSARFGPLWSIMAPFNKPGATDSPENLLLTKAELDPRYLAKCLTWDETRVIFTANAGGVHSPNSKYARCELRELKAANMDREGQAAWANASGTHTMEYEASITHNLVYRKRICIGQLHDVGDDVFLIVYDNGKLLLAYHSNGSSGDSLSLDLGPLDQGQRFKVKFVGHDSKFDIYRDGVLKKTISKSMTGLYYKLGAYLQATSGDFGSDYPYDPEAADATASVSIYSAKVTHA